MQMDMVFINISLVSIYILKLKFTATKIIPEKGDGKSHEKPSTFILHNH